MLNNTIAGHFNLGHFNPKQKPWTFQPQYLYFSDCQGTFVPECQKLIRSASKEISVIQCWGKPLYAYCKATDGTVFPILGYKCEHSTCPDDAKGQIATGELHFSK